MRLPKLPQPQETLPQEREVQHPDALGVVLRITGAVATPPELALKGRCRIGSGAECDVVVDDRMVSRAHVELELADDGARVRDLDSRNGTFYLSQRIERAVLAVGARIQIGQATIAIDVDEGALRADLGYEGEEYRGLLGKSRAMQQLFALLVRLERSLVPVLVAGESGVGKEMFARALHEGSAVGAGPLVSINCGALPRELVASELFGHRRGAFTGAGEARKGAFESADGGTLFLDEIGELALDVQPMLLRALETGEVRRVGEDTASKVRVRVVAATNRDLEEEVAQGRFREDLFFRLAVLRLTIPPLRERLEDIEPLAQRFAAEEGLTELPGAVIEQLKARAWPGNVRELRNALRAYAVLGVLPKPTRSKPATLDLSLRESIDGRGDYTAQKDALVDRFTAIYLALLMETAKGNKTVAGRIAGLDRGYLARLLVKHGLAKG